MGDDVNEDRTSEADRRAAHWVARLDRRPLDDAEHDAFRDRRCSPALPHRFFAGTFPRHLVGIRFEHLGSTPIRLPTLSKDASAPGCLELPTRPKPL